MLTDDQREVLDYLYTRDQPWTWMSREACAELEQLHLAERHPDESRGTKWRLSLAGIRAWMLDEQIIEHERKRANGEVRGCFYLTLRLRKTSDGRHEQV